MLEGTLIEGRYRIVRPLGRGGMAQVYEGVDLRLDRRVALKRLADEYAAKPRVRARFLDEGLIQARLSHPNLVHTSDCIEDASGLFIVMEYIEGETLDDYLDRVGSVSLSEAYDILGPVCEALEVVHRSKIVHRDLKPANLMLDRSQGRVIPRLIDFGVAKVVDGSGRRATQYGATIGTPHYMPPEQQRGVVDLDARADVYALGVIAHRMVLGVLPPVGVGLASTRETPPLFDDLLARALAPDRSERLADVSVFGEALRRLAELERGGAGTGPHRVSTPTTTVSPPVVGGATVTPQPDEPGPASATVVSAGDESSTRWRGRAGLLAGSLVAGVAAVAAGVAMSGFEWPGQPASAVGPARVAGEPAAPSAPVSAADGAEAARSIGAIGLCRDDAGCGPGRQCVDGWCVAIPSVPDGMVWVPGGRFTMGDGCAGDAPAHSVRLSGFAIDRTMREGGRGVTWFEALAACEARGYSLPTEAQWERAAGDGLVELTLGRGEWVVDWYHSDGYRLEALPEDPVGPAAEACERDPGRWRTSAHWRPDRRCTRVVRGVAHGACDRVHARSFFGPYVAGDDRGYRCVDVPPRSVTR